MSGVAIADIQALIIAEVGDTPTGTLATLMPTIWASYADKALVSPRLQELYAKRRAIDLVLGGLRGAVDITIDGLAKRNHQQVDTLIAMRKTTEDDIVAVEQRSRGMRGAALQPLINTEIETPPTGPRPFGPLSGNSPELGGDPYYRTNGTRDRGW